jgi:hypothetical protein
MRSLFLAGCMAVVLAAPLSAQYFGRNKVLYKKLDIDAGEPPEYPFIRLYG